MNTFAEMWAEFQEELAHEARLAAMTQEERDKQMKKDAEQVVRAILDEDTPPK